MHPYDCQCICLDCINYELNLTAVAQWDQDQTDRRNLDRKRDQTEMIPKLPQLEKEKKK